MLELTKKVTELGRELIVMLMSVANDGLVERDRLTRVMREADARERVLGLRQHCERAAQHGRERYVLPLVVEHGEQREHVAHFHGREEPGAAFAVHGDARLPQHVGILVGLELHRAEKDDDVAEADVARREVAIGIALDDLHPPATLDSHDLADAADDEDGLTACAYGWVGVFVVALLVLILGCARPAGRRRSWAARAARWARRGSPTFHRCRGTVAPGCSSCDASYTMSGGLPRHERREHTRSQRGQVWGAAAGNLPGDR
jgi:hypothetical protein